MAVFSSLTDQNDPIRREPDPVGEMADGGRRDRVGAPVVEDDDDGFVHHITRSSSTSSARSRATVRSDSACSMTVDMPGQIP